MRLVVESRPGLPAIENIRQAEQPSDQPRLRVLRRTPEKGVVVEIEIDDVSVAVHRDARDVVPDIAVPIRTVAVGIGIHVADVASWAVIGRLRPRQLPPVALRVDPDRAVLVAVPEPPDQLHQQIAVDAMALLGGSVLQFLCIDVVVDVHDRTERLVPIVLQGLLQFKAGPERIGLARLRRRRAAGQNPRRARCRDDEIASVGRVVLALVVTPVFALVHQSLLRFASRTESISEATLQIVQIHFQKSDRAHDP